MTDNALQGLVKVLVELVDPLADAARDEQAFGRFLAQMSWSAQTVDLGDVAEAVDTLMKAFEELGEGLSFESLDDLIKTLGSLQGTATAVTKFATALARAAGDPAASAAVVGELADDTLQHLVLTWIGGRSAMAYSALALIGVIDWRTPQAIATAGPDPLLRRAAVVRPVLAPEALAALLGDPIGHVRARLGIQPLVSDEVAVAVLDAVFSPIRDLIVTAGGTGSLGTDVVPSFPADPARRRASLLLPLPVPATGLPLRSWLSVAAELVPAGKPGPAGEPGPGLSLEPGGGLRVSLPLPGSKLDLELTAGIAALFFPEGGHPVVHLEGAEGVHLRAEYATVTEGDRPAIVLGADSLGLTVGGVTAVVDLRLGRRDDPSLAVNLHAAVQQASFRLAPEEGDGFLGKVLPADGLRFDFELGIGWSTGRGLYLAGAASLEAEVPLHVSLLGVLTIDVVHVRVAVDGAAFELAVAATVSLKLGPVSATVERMGLGTRAVSAPGGGNAGPMQVDPRFVPPRGVGLAIKAAVVAGGGYILNDHENGRYAGILQLKISDIVTVNAIGLVSTRMPDGSRDFSLLVIITATFPPLQLGFGFTLSGLGGLLGLNRTMNVQALRDGARTGVLDSILFPVDPVARATKVISDVEAVFPVAPGRFVMGFMARLGWGSRSLLSVDLGVILELPLPLRIALIGRLGVVLPADEAAIVELHLDIVGILDLGRGELSIDACLHDSRLAVFDITGDMAVRVGWGANPTMVLSVGGLNPRSPRLPGLPDLRRLSISLAKSKNPSVRLETYFAVTSNTIQVGARLSAHAELNAGIIGKFTADAWLGFDVLITLVPFEFIVDLSGGIVIRRNGKPFIGAEVLLTLYGPQPMRAVGYAEVHFLGTHRLPFDVTVGPAAAKTVLAAVDPVGTLVGELSRIESWSCSPPRDAVGVALRDTSAEVLLAHPRGELTVRQRVLPLEVRVDRFGGLPIAGGSRTFRLDYRLGDLSVAPGVPARDAWAPGEYFALSDDEKISRPSFEQLVSGNAGIASVGLRFGAARDSGDPGYETRVIDADELARPAAAYQIPASLGAMMSELDAARWTVGYTGPDKRVTVVASQFRVAGTAELVAEDGVHQSWLEANEALDGRPGWQIVGAHEVKP